MKGIYFGSDNDIVSKKILDLQNDIIELKQKYDSKCDELKEYQEIARTLTTHTNELYTLIKNIRERKLE